MKTIFSLLKLLLTALPLSALFLLGILVSARLFTGDRSKEFMQYKKYAMRVLRAEVGKTFLESVAALYVAWHLGAVTINRAGVMFTLLNANDFLSADLWVFAAGLSAMVLAFHGGTLALECLFRPARGFVSDFSSDTAWRPLIGTVFGLVDRVRGMTRVACHLLRCALKV